MRELVVAGFSTGQHVGVQHLNPSGAIALGLHPPRTLGLHPDLPILLDGSTYTRAGKLWASNRGANSDGEVVTGRAASRYGRQVLVDAQVLLEDGPSGGEFSPNVGGFLAGHGLHGIAFRSYGDRGVYVDFRIDGINRRLQFTRGFAIVDEPYGKRTSENIVHTWDETYIAQGFWDRGAFNTFGFSIAHPRWTLYANGEALGMYDVAPLFDLGGQVPAYRKVVQSHWTGPALTVGDGPGLAGELWCALVYGNSLPMGLVRLPDMGRWTSEIHDLKQGSQERYCLHRVEWKGWVCSHHSVRLRLRVGADEALEDHTTATYVLPPGLSGTFYPEPHQFIAGRYVDLQLQFTTDFYGSPHLTEVRLYWRALSA